VGDHDDTDRAGSTFGSMQSIGSGTAVALRLFANHRHFELNNFNEKSTSSSMMRNLFLHFAQDNGSLYYGTPAHYHVPAGHVDELVPIPDIMHPHSNKCFDVSKSILREDINHDYDISFLTVDAKSGPNASSEFTGMLPLSRARKRVEDADRAMDEFKSADVRSHESVLLAIAQVERLMHVYYTHIHPSTHIHAPVMKTGYNKNMSGIIGKKNYVRF